MLPNRFAWPPDCPMTRFCEPCGPFVDELLWLTSVPCWAICRSSGVVRKIVSRTSGGCVNPYGVLCAVYGNGLVSGPRLLKLPGTGLAVSRLMLSMPGTVPTVPMTGEPFAASAALAKYGAANGAEMKSPQPVAPVPVYGKSQLPTRTLLFHSNGIEVLVSDFGPGLSDSSTLPSAPPSKESAKRISPASLPPRPMRRWPSDAPRSMLAMLGFDAADDPRRRTVIGSLKLTSDAFLRNDLRWTTRGFFFTCLRSCALIRALAFGLSFLAGATAANEPMTSPHATRTDSSLMTPRCDTGSSVRRTVRTYDGRAYARISRRADLLSSLWLAALSRAARTGKDRNPECRGRRDRRRDRARPARTSASRS